jgi:hypothetical protein
MGKEDWVIDLREWSEPIRTMALIGAIVGILVAVFGGMFLGLLVIVFAAFSASTSLASAGRVWFGWSGTLAEYLAVGLFLVFATIAYYAVRLVWRRFQHT